MTLPPSMVAAVREAKGCRRGPALSGAACCGDCAEAIARSVLRAALTGEVEGPYRAEPSSPHDGVKCWYVRLHGRHTTVRVPHSFVEAEFPSEAEARAVANALHLLAALSGEDVRAFAQSAAERDRLAQRVRDLEGALERVKRHRLFRTMFESAPCILCGYNGHDYYQSDAHPCAKVYHAALRGAGEGNR